jgi:membrane-bound ClpP family serine protease
MSNWKSELPHLTRYALLQIPGICVVTALLWLANEKGWIGLAGGTALILVWIGGDVAIYFLTRRSMRAGYRSGVEALPGSIVVALTPLAPTGFAQLGPERWHARLAGGGQVEVGTRLRIDEVRGLELVVSRDSGTRP